MKLLKLVPDDTNVDFMRWRNVALVLSVLLTVASLALTAYRGLNLGIDFVGGQVVRATFVQPVDIEDLRSKVSGLNVGEASIQEFGDNRTYQIRLPSPDGPDAAANQVVTAAFNQPRGQAETDLRNYFTANPGEYYDLKGILAPIGDKQRQCKVAVLPADLQSAYDTFMAG